MKHNRQILIAFITFTTFTFIGCVTNPVYNVVDAPVSTSTKNYSTRSVRTAILQAGASLGWQMQDTSPGRIVGTLNLRDHMAQVEIIYNHKTYSITYKDSKNLDYNGTKIHKNYNSWIQNLSTEINTRLSTI